MSKSITPYGSVPNRADGQMNRGYGTAPNTGVNDFAQGNPSAVSPLSQSAAQPQGVFHEDFDVSRRGSSVVGSSVAGDGNYGLDRSASTASTAVPASAPARSNTLKKKSSVKRMGSVKRSGSKRSLAAGSIKGVGGAEQEREKDYRSVFHTPIPTQGSPTEVLANRFQAWRQLLKSLIAYFREVQGSYEARAKALNKVESSISGIIHPSIFASQNGLGDATRILDDYHKRSIAEASKSRDIENDVIGALTGLRSDLGQKIKEIKSLSGDFKNSVDKEKEGTRREVEKLQEALQHADHEDGTATGKNDPFVVRLGVERTVERQIDEENYLHRAYLNLESSGRELESIVVGEIQKAYNALAGILKREADDAYNVVEGLRGGPISMPKDQEWMQFVVHDPHFVDPNVPPRRVEDIDYPGKHHPAAAEVRSGMLERKSKYLKSYTPGWYVLSPTHLHEFKSADKIYSQPPVMSLYLLDQRLGSKSEATSSSHKFMLKGKQSGSMHKGHNWVFRAETHETMLAWFEDIRTLTESTGEVRNAFVRKHARSVSGTSERGTVSSDGFEDDEADAAPYSADANSLAGFPQQETRLQRPLPGGRFPSDLQVPRREPQSPSSGSSEPDRDVVAAAGALPGSIQQEYDRNGQNPYKLDGISTGARMSAEYDPGPSTTGDYSYYDQSPVLGPARSQPQQTDDMNVASPPPQMQGFTDHSAPVQTQTFAMPLRQEQPLNQQQQPIPAQKQAPSVHQPTGLDMQQPAAIQQAPQPRQRQLVDDESSRHNSMYGDWMAPAAAGVAGAGVGAAGAQYQRDQRERADLEAAQQAAPDVPQRSEGAIYNQGASEGGGGGFLANGNIAQPSRIVGEPVDDAPVSATGLSGPERHDTQETGRFPKVVRHNTDFSISALHVPGEYPKKV